MSNLKKILDSFNVQNSLNPKIWENPTQPKKSKLKERVRKGLLKIADVFIEDLGDDIPVTDIYLMGSLANFNWSEFSDFDLHVIVDMEKYGKDAKLYEELFDLKKKLFNLKHDIFIFGYDVELYAQPLKAESHSDGVYSLTNDKWVNVPEKTEKKLDQELLKKKIKSWTEKIDNAIETAEVDGNTDIIKKIKDKLKDYRQMGLRNEGEFSYENLVFKYLRRSGYVEKLFDTKNKVTDKKLSIETKLLGTK